jgi:DNA-3-methyladenine glycosylase II
MEFAIHPPAPFHFDLTLQRYRLFGEDAAHLYAAGVYQRVIDVDGQLWVYALRGAGPPEAPILHVQLFGRRAGARHRLAVEAEVRHCLSLDVPLIPFYRWAQAEPILATLVRRCFGMRPPRAPTLFEALITAITAQQVNLTFATTVRSRLIRRYGRAVTSHGQTFYAFPTPERLATAPPQELRELQFSWRKAESIVNLARLVADGRLKLDELPALSNAAIIERLTPIKGLGRWTADWLLARGLGRGDAIAAGDLGVRKAVGRFYCGGRLPSAEEVRALAARWGAYQNLAVHYLLAGLRLADHGAAGGGETIGQPSNAPRHIA